jgi:predicted dehydrogenase
MSNNRLSVAVIGRSNHAARHIGILKKLPKVRLTSVLYPKKCSPTDLPLTKNLADLFSADAIFVSSPTPTHAAYLKRLSKYRGYVLIEKPAVSTVADVTALRRWPASRKKRARINFNLIHSDLYQAFQSALHDKRLGKLLSFDLHTSHGLAFKTEYKNSWRNKGARTAGVLETVGIHYVHLALTAFGLAESTRADLTWAASKTGPSDTATLQMKMKSGVDVTLRQSYGAPFLVRWLLIGTNGYWEYDGQTARLHTPRDTFDSLGRFTSPPMVKTWRIDHASAWKQSLARADQSFLSTVAKKGSFDPADFDRGLDASTIILKSVASAGKGASGHVKR